MHDLFISYSRQDTERVEVLAELLESAGISCWIDKQGIDLATSWSGEIVDAIEGCKAFLVLLSPASIVSTNVVKEVSLAAELKKKILPLDLEPVELSRDLRYHLAGIQRAPMTNIDAIIRALGKIGLEATGAPSYQIVKEPRVARLSTREPDPNAVRVETRTTQDDRKSLMILPFEDLSPTGDNQWFADGLASEMISALANIKSLRLSDNQATKEFRKYHGQLVTYAREMSIRYFVQGSVRKMGDQVKIAMHLLDIETGDYLWQDAIKGTMTDIFEIQENAARSVADGLKLHLTQEEKSKLAERGTENAEAWELYVKGNQYFDLHTKEGFEYALRLFREAIQLDPGFAEAYGAAANTLPAIYRSYDRNPMYLEEAERLIEKARELKPSLHRVLDVLSLIRILQGKLDEAESLAKQYVELEPENFRSHFALGFFYMETNQSARAIPCFEEGLRLKPDKLMAHWNLTINSANAGDGEAKVHAAERALPLYEKRMHLFPDDENARVSHALLLCHAGRLDEARTALASMEDVKDANSLYNNAVAYVKLGDYQKALSVLRRSVERGFANVSIIETWPDDDELKEHPELVPELEAIIALAKKGTSEL